ncbi:hypothetical protein LCGC14_2981180, partial [marine sediment metagenome]
MSFQKEQIIGFKEEAVFQTDPIVNTAETFYKFGEFNRSFGEFPDLETELLPVWNGTSYDPASITIANTRITGGIAGTFLNFIPYYMMFGRIESSSGLEDGGFSD